MVSDRENIKSKRYNVTVMSDDGVYETGVMLDELGDKHDIKITVSGIVSYVEPHLKEWKELEKRGTWN